MHSRKAVMWKFYENNITLPTENAENIKKPPNAVHEIWRQILKKWPIQSLIKNIADGKYRMVTRFQYQL